MCTATEMPKYKSHKEVWALKIRSIVLDESGSALIAPEDDGYDKFEVSKEYMDKHNPKAGGYYVVYKDGYKSFSPAKAFEEGNELIENRGPFGNFGDAIKALKKGHKVCRFGWNGKNMFLHLAYPELGDGSINAAINYNYTFDGAGTDMLENFIVMKTANNKLVPWLASQTDMLAEDWRIVE